MEVKYPKISTIMNRKDENANSVLWKMQAALRGGGVDEKEVNELTKIYMREKYNDFFEICEKWINIKPN